MYRCDELNEFRVSELRFEMNVYVHHEHTQSFSLFFFGQKAGVNVIKVLHLFVTRVAFVSLAENNSCSCKLS